MKYLYGIIILVLQLATSHAQNLSTPDLSLKNLFQDVQLSGVFKDGKTFVDCTPKIHPDSILRYYNQKKTTPHFDLSAFVHQYFIVPEKPVAPNLPHTTESFEEHLHRLWTTLERSPDTVQPYSTLIPLPYQYVVPGGRFRESYYWDSYFTMLGLYESKKYDLVENMVANFAHLITHYEHIPNGMRTYYLSRSQPPFFSLMVDLLAKIKGDDAYRTYFAALEKEYAYWMDRSHTPTKHVVMLYNNVLNRYWDADTIPRQESFKQDYAITDTLPPKAKSKTNRDLRSGAESGWDFSSRWLDDPQHLATIQTTDYIPVDLNALLYHLEKVLGYASTVIKNEVKAKAYNLAAQKRKRAINTLFLNKVDNWYYDLRISSKNRSPRKTLAGMVPLFLNIADSSLDINSLALFIKQHFLKPGGLITTTEHTHHQWDAPNGWAPLQYMSIVGLSHYHQNDLAKDIAQRWLAVNEKVFYKTGKMMEKYNVVNIDLEAGGGEYDGQDGFGWTNGVALYLLKHYADTKKN